MALMRTLITAFLLVLMATAASAQTPPAPAPGSALPFTLKNLGHGIYVAIDNAKGESGANAGFVIGD